MMQEIKIRKIHRTLAIWLVGLIIIQVLSGLAITIGSFFAPHEHRVQEQKEAVEVPPHNGTENQQTKSNDLLSAIHHGGGLLGKIYRTLLASGILTVAVTGIMIYAKMKARMKKKA